MGNSDSALSTQLGLLFRFFYPLDALEWGSSSVGLHLAQTSGLTVVSVLRISDKVTATFILPGRSGQGVGLATLKKKKE